jgi:hypothetical protein
MVHGPTRSQDSAQQLEPAWVQGEMMGPGNMKM